MAKKKDILTNHGELRSPVPIVGIGASAGGLQAVSDLLSHLSPHTGFAYVYIQHLNPDFDSKLTSILERVTEMKVFQAEHQMEIKADHVYVIPPGQDMEVNDGKLSLVTRQPKPMSHMPIDQFFVSLSEKQREGAVAIILSGMASDGTIGLKAVKVAGGITFAQDESALFQSMPKSAIAEGVVDMVLSPADIAAELEQLSAKSDVFRQTADADTFEDAPDNDEDLKSIIHFLKKAVGMDFGHYKMTTIRRRIIRRMLLYKLETLKEYNKYLKQHLTEATVLYNDLLINVTSFFRDPETMDYVKKVLLPQIIKGKDNGEQIRVWIPACSTGEEAYSFAIMLLEVIGDKGTGNPIQIFATDLSMAAIAKARQGNYNKSEVIGLSSKRLQKFFTPIDDHYRINKFVRDLCVFAPHNVFSDPPFSRLDMVSCRNLLIYVNNSLQRKAISTFHYSLNPSGFLILGKSETVGTSASLFNQTEKNHKIFSRRNDVISRASFEMTPKMIDMERPELVGKPGKPKSTSIPANDLDKVVDVLLLSQYVPASVVINQDLEILQFRGAVSMFLEPSPGRASLNLLKMARASLVFDLRSIIHKAKKTGQPVKKSGIEIKISDKTHQIAIEAVPIKTNAEDHLFLVLFEEVIPTVQSQSKSSVFRDLRIKKLEDELVVVREDLHSIIEEQEASNEELQSANEEIVSSNEELQSINEELETSKEEIESTNEELLTINQELLVRNDQLSEAYSFSESIFGIIREATLILDKDLRVKSANKAFYKVFKAHQDDTEGKLIYELGNRQWDIPGLRQLLDEIISDNNYFQDYEVRHTFPEIGEKIMKLNARKVVRQQSQQAILVAIEDITEQVRAQRLLEEREAWFHDIADNAPMLTWVAGIDGNYNFLNKALLHYTGRDTRDAELHWVNSIHPEDRAGYIAAYESNFQKRQPFQSEYRLQHQGGEYRWIFENAKPIFLSQDNVFSGFMGSCADIHNQKLLNQEQMSRQIETSEETIRSLDEMREYVQQRGAFLRATTHDLRGSFGMILGATSLLNMVSANVEKDQAFEMLQRNLRHVTHTITQLLDYSRLESGQERLEPASFDAGEMFAELSAGLKPSAVEKKLTLHTEGEPHFQVHGDMVKVRRIAQNLLLNAIKYTGEGDITFSWGQETADSWFLNVRDTGKGLTQELLNYLNVGTKDGQTIQDIDNEQSDVSKKGFSDGEGIGLFIVKRLCKVLSARVEVNSEAENGTSFKIIFPNKYVE